MVNSFPDVYLLGEISERHAARKYTGPDLLHGSYFFDLLDMKGKLKAGALKVKLADIYNDFPDYDMALAISNHDFARHVSRYEAAEGLEQEFAKMIAALFLLLPGGYCLYQGEELGLPAADLTFEQTVDCYDLAVWPNGVGRDRARTPMPWYADSKNAGFSSANETWLPVDQLHNALAVYKQNDDEHSTLNCFRQIIQFRKNHLSHLEAFSFVDTAHPDVLGYRLQTTRGAVTCIFNLSTVTLELSLPEGCIIEELSSQRPDVVTGNPILVLPPYGRALFKA
jgi:alpha-glucosidase